MELLDRVQVCDSTNSAQKNYRIKICVNFFDKNKTHIRSYNDNITCQYLLEKINIFIDILIKSNNRNISYAVFQKSNYKKEYGVIITMINLNDEDIDIISNFNDEELIVKGYSSLNNQHHKIVYIGQEKHLTNFYYDFIWKQSLQSFIQTNTSVSNEIHQTVDRLLNKDNINSKLDNFYGLGGEMGVYYYRNKNSFKKGTCFTNSKEIYEDYILNTGDDNVYLVDYDKFSLKNYLDTHSNNVLVINISRNGLKELAVQINKLNFKQIIYIGCSEKTVRKDANNLSRYVINQVYKFDMFPGTDYYSYVINFIQKL